MMFCNQCGTSLTDDARFCPKCGKAVNYVAKSADEQPDRQPEQQLEQPVQPGQPEGQAQGGQQPQPSPSRKRTVVIAAVTAVVVVAVAAIGVFAFLQNKAYEDAHRESAVTLIFRLPDYGSGEGTGVPIQVTGTDIDGTEVSETLVAPASSGEVKLKRGNYQVTVVGSPVSDEGRIYEIPTQPVEVVIDEKGIHVPGSSEFPLFDFVAIPPDQITDEQIAAISAWMADLGINQGTIDHVVGQITALRQQEQERIAEEQRKAEEEARRKAEEEARQRAAALAAEAFGSFPRSFSFTSGAGAWSTEMTIDSDGSFSGQWHDANMGVTGPGYPGGTMLVCDFAGSFTALEKVSDTDYLLQLDEVHATQPAGDSIEDGRKIERHDDEPYGLGSMTSSPVGGWHLYLPGQSTAGFSDAVMMWLYPGGKKYQESTLSMYALVNEDLGYAWFSK